MSVKFNIAQEGLTRDGSYFDPAAIWSWLFWVKPPVVASSYSAIYVFGDLEQTDSYIIVFVDNTGIGVDFWDGTTLTTLGTVSIDYAIWKSFGVSYNPATTTVSLFVNGVSVDSAVLDLSTFTFTAPEESLFFDPYITNAGLEIFDVRTWQILLSAVDFTNEALFDTAQITMGLLTDTPLTSDSDLADSSGNGHDWTAVGSGSSRTSPTLIPPSTSNTDATTAYDLGTLPKTIIQNVRATGTTLTAWFKLTSDPADQVVIGSFGFGDISVYKPTAGIFIGPASAPVAWNSIAGQNIPLQFPVGASVEYFIRELRNSSAANPAFLVLDVLAAPNGDAEQGDIAINDDSGGFPLAILDVENDYAIKKFIYPFPAGEAGDTLPNGNCLVEDIDTPNVTMFNRSYDTVGSTGIAQGVEIRSNRTALDYAVGIKTNPVTLKYVTQTGVLSALIATLTGNTSIQGIATNNDKSLLYFSRSAVGDALRVWDIGTDTAAANLAAGIATYIISDILVLPDDTLLVGYYKTADFNVKHYSAAGAVLATYSLGVGGGTLCRLAYALDTPNSFWAWTHPTGGDAGKTKLQNVKISDGSIIRTRIYAEFEGGAYVPAPTSNPLARFGNSFSCPFWIITSAPVIAKSGLYTITGTGGNNGGTINPIIRHDEDWIDTSLGTHESVEIPDPFYDTFLAGDE